jgi:hypothetical protein
MASILREQARLYATFDALPTQQFLPFSFTFLFSVSPMLFIVLVSIFRFLPFLYLLGVIAVFVHNIKKNFKNVVVDKMELKLNASFEIEVPRKARWIMVSIFGGYRGFVLLVLGIVAWFVSF